MSMLSKSFIEGNQGKFIFARYKGEDKRLYIDQLNIYQNVMHKNGWWNLFSLSNKKIEKVGLYLCTIEAFTQDKNEHDILILSPIKFIEDKDIRLMQLIICASSEYASSEQESSPFSTLYYISKLGLLNEWHGLMSFERKENLEWMKGWDYNKLLKEFIEGEDIEESLKDIRNKLAMPTKEETFKEIANNFVPMLIEENEEVRRIVRAKRERGEFPTSSKILEELLDKYQRLVNSGKIQPVDSIYSQVLAFTDYNIKFREEKAAARKAAKKAKKKEKRGNIIEAD